LLVEKLFAMATQAASALSGLGSDLSVSISFNVALELVNSARESQIGDEELVATLVLFIVVLTTARAAVGKRLADARAVTQLSVEASAEAEKEKDPSFEVDPFVKASMNSYDESRGLLAFLELLLSLAQRISIAVAIQVLAFAVRTTAPSRTVRITTLLGVVLFFLFLEQQLGRRI
jgi:hypothetical protein